MSFYSELSDAIIKRDSADVDKLNSSAFCGTLEGQLSVTSGRAVDALAAILKLLQHLDELEKTK